MSITPRQAILVTLTTSLIVSAAADTIELNPLVVTATKFPTRASSLVAQTTVINKEALTRYQGQSVLDALKSQAGISHYTSGGSDKASNFYMRGFDSGSILVLIDGVRYGSLTTGQSALGLLDVNEVERIEILHGASGAALHGSNAVGGVVQIFTKKGLTNGSRLSASVGAGSHNQLTYGASAGFANDNTKLNLTASHNESDGFNTIATPYVATQRDDDGYNKDSISASLSHRMGKVEIGGNFLQTKGDVQYDNTYGTESTIYDQQKGGATSGYISFDYAPESSIKLQHGVSIDESNNFSGSRSTGVYNSKQIQTNLSLIHTLPIGKVIAGAEKLDQEVESSTKYSQTKRDNTGYYLGYQINHNNLDGQAFVRQDDNSWYGKHDTYNVGLAYRFGTVRMGANYATGFKAPTFNQLYWPRSGNPNLTPEHTKNTEAFIELNGNNHKTRITGYHNKVTDLIAGWPSKNINEAKITGITLTSDWQLNNYLFGVNYDYQDANDVTTGKSNLVVRPEHKGGAYIGYAHDKFNVRAEYQRVGSYYMGANHTSKMNGYDLLNLSATYQLTPHIHIAQRLNNLLNEKYTTNESWGTRYNEDGTNFYTSVTFSY